MMLWHSRLRSNWFTFAASAPSLNAYGSTLMEQLFNRGIRSSNTCSRRCFDCSADPMRSVIVVMRRHRILVVVRCGVT